MITESEKFLNQIEKEKLDLTNLKKDFKDLESFLEIYELLKGNLDKLQDMKESMDESGKWLCCSIQIFKSLWLSC